MPRGTGTPAAASRSHVRCLSPAMRMNSGEGESNRPPMSTTRRAAVDRIRSNSGATSIVASAVVASRSNSSQCDDRLRTSTIVQPGRASCKTRGSRSEVTWQPASRTRSAASAPIIAVPSRTSDAGNEPGSSTNPPPVAHS